MAAEGATRGVLSLSAAAEWELLATVLPAAFEAKPYQVLSAVDVLGISAAELLPAAVAFELILCGLYGGRAAAPLVA
jgi:hypothetical protein